MIDFSNQVHDLGAAAGVLIGASWRSGELGTFDVENPADKSVVSVVANGSTRQAAEAVDAAYAALPTWASTSPRHRSEILYRVFEYMHRDADDLAQLIATENGKSTADAAAEVTYAAEFFRWYAEEAVRTDGGYGSSPAGGTRTIVTHRPVGVVAMVTPWNFPAAMATRKIAPALAAGCTVVLKPAAETPLTTIAIARLLQTAGLPPGVVNVLPTLEAPEVVSAWLGDSRVRKVSFTGSTAVGRKLLRQAADRVVNASMELGGNAPFIVMPDADIAAAVDGAMTAKFRGGGQACTAANRFYVHASVTDEFLGLMGARLLDLNVGDGRHPATQIGPLITQRAVDSTASLVNDAVAGGARVAAQPQLPNALSGYFYPPTLLADVAADAPVIQEETFAPVAPVVTWTDEVELLEWVNGTEMGLAAYLYSGDLKKALQFAEKIEAGMVGINRGLISDPAAPFGGMKQSGLGREGARDGLAEYQETQYFSVDWSDR